MLYEYPFRSHFLDIDGNRLHYVDEGNGPVIVLLHGNPTWSYHYRNLIKKLRKRFRVIAPDHMGCGLSDKPQSYDYCLENHIANLTKLLDFLGVKKLSLGVHDWGGAIGFGFGGRQPERIQSFFVMNTAAFRSARIPMRIQLCRLPVFGEILVKGFNGFAYPATFMAVRRKLDRRVVRGYLEPYRKWRHRVWVHGFVKDIPLSPGHRSYATLLSVEKRLVEIRDRDIPLYIAWGGKDFCFDDWFYAEWRKRFPKASYRYFADAGHYLLEDRKDDILALANEFFSATATR